MKGEELTLWALAGIGVVALLWMINEQTAGDRPGFNPEVQSDEDVLGVGAQAGMSLSLGTPLDMSYHLHGWHPGYDPDPNCIQTITTAHRYPAVPGGNLSTVMHKGWSAASQDAPAGNSWRLNPPEASVMLWLPLPYLANLQVVATFLHVS